MVNTALRQADATEAQFWKRAAVAPPWHLSKHFVAANPA